METRAPYALIGLFVLAAIGAVFGFVFWLHNTGGLGERTVYRVRFENTVSGLLTGAAVLFNGIRVGEVTDLGLNPDNPHEVMATIAVVTTTPVRVDTQAGLEFQGLTGVPVISLRGGSAEAATLASTKDRASVLVADSAAGQSMTEAARQALHRLDVLLADNSGDLKSAITNLNTFTGALARNSDRVDNILSGLDRMTAGAPAKPVATTYDLKAPVTFPQPHNDKASKSQLVIVEPTAVVALDTQRIIVGPGIADGPTSDNAQWSDTIPKLLQAKIIQSFENANYLGAVARPMDGLTPDYQLLIDVRAFQVSTSPTDAAKPVARVGFGAKILGNNGRIIGSRTFNAEVAAMDIGAPGAAAALDAAFGKAAVDLVVWTVGAI
jgi:phospholipid/cholesterol/gamma-HCH transport system substrate-binding protein